MGATRLDLFGLTAGGLITDAQLGELQQSAKSAFSWISDKRAAGSIGFLDLPDDRPLVDRCVEYCSQLPPEIDTMIVLGIGGSSLGPNALNTALGTPELAALAGALAGRRVLFPDNPDPRSFSAMLDGLDLSKCVFNVVTKSGSTAETIAQLLVVAGRLESELGGDALKKHLVVTTDPSAGPLRSLSDRLGLHSFDVPPSVGGRFSVLSAVGLLPGAFAGLDVHGLLVGAARMRDRVLASDNPMQNPALMLAGLLHLHDQVQQRPIVVVMPYADALYGMADWFRQLWAESLGKAKSIDGRDVHVGPTPVASRGATDQHSQLQLYAEGPDDKAYLFVGVDTWATDVAIPSGLCAIPEYSYLVGHSLGELMDAEMRGTIASLRQRGRPTGQIRLSGLDGESVGELILLLEAATAFAGPMYGVDPFDQPGVEHAKRLAYGALGREGFAEYRKELDAGAFTDGDLSF